MRKPSVESDEKRARTHAAKMAKRKTNVTVVGDWRVFYLDESNWVLAKKDATSDDYRYYPSKAHALIALSEQRIGDLPGKSLEECKAAIYKTRAEIMEAIRI